MIYRFLLLFSTLLLFAGCSFTSNKPPEFMLGEFRDDYEIEYKVSNDLWFQKPNAKFHIEEWNVEEQYLIARNDSLNPSEQGLYTRFDWMEFENLLPYEWGFCMTTYGAETIREAKNIMPPDRENPREGCNGFPFSRMRSQDL
ncbi:MAG: hypothetical protein WD053_06690 [Gracilimonas sp.]